MSLTFKSVKSLPQKTTPIVIGWWEYCGCILNGLMGTGGLGGEQRRFKERYFPNDLLDASKRNNNNET